MKKILYSIFLLLVMICLTPNCAKAMGLFYTNASYPITATGTTVKDLDALKKGSASSTNILFLVELGDAGIDVAAKKANITKISYIDVTEKSIFIFWRKVTVNVYGE